MAKTAEFARELVHTSLTGPVFHRQSNMYANLVMAMARTEFAGQVGRHRDMWLTQSHMMDLGIALNEDRDVGDAVRDRIKKGNYTQSRYESMRAAVRTLDENYLLKREKLLRLRPDLSDTVAVWEAEAKILSEHRHQIHGEEIYASVNIDSAMYTIPFLQAMSPGLINGFPADEMPSSWEELKDKYSYFTGTPDTYSRAPKDMQKLLALHAGIMEAKTVDDDRGTEVDSYLQIKGFTDYTDYLANRNGTTSRDEMTRLQNLYHEASHQFGWGLVNGGLRVLSKVRSIRLDPLDKVPDSNIPEEVSSFIKKYSATTGNMRENLEHAGLLRGLLGRDVFLEM